MTSVNYRDYTHTNRHLVYISSPRKGTRGWQAHDRMRIKVGMWLLHFPEQTVKLQLIYADKLFLKAQFGRNKGSPPSWYLISSYNTGATCEYGNHSLGKPSASEPGFIYLPKMRLRPVMLPTVLLIDYERCINYIPKITMEVYRRPIW